MLNALVHREMMFNLAELNALAVKLDLCILSPNVTERARIRVITG